MQNRTRFAFALTALTAALASCGTPSTPTAQLVKVDVVAPMGVTPGVKRGLSAQGFTSDAPTRYYDVIVRDSNDNVVTFNGTTYDPTGNGAAVLRLNDANKFKQTLLLPAGTYTFENKVKDEGTSVLLGYGPGNENTGTVDAQGSLIRLKSHAVLDKANTTLSPSMAMNELYTDTRFNLSLNLKTASFGGAVATVPTSDISPVTYTLGNATDGVLNGNGSKIGVNVTSRGTDTDSILNVTASFSAWVQDYESDTASPQQVSIDFAKQIQTNVMTTDTVMPAISLNTSEPLINTTTTLSGTASDDTMIQGLRVYVDGNLIASMDEADGVGIVNGDSNGGWSAPWMVGGLGTYAVTVIAEDSSGNETRVDRSVTSTEAELIEVNGYVQYFERSYQAGESRTFRIKNASETIYAYNYMYGSDNDSVSAVLINSAGQAMNQDPYFQGMYDIAYFYLNGHRDDFTFTVTSTVNQTIVHYIY